MLRMTSCYSLRGGVFFAASRSLRARAAQHVRQRVVALVARVLVDQLVGLHRAALRSSPVNGAVKVVGSSTVNR